jgi:preprotein translocase subunit SecA
MSIFNKIFGSKADKDMKVLKPVVEKVNAHTAVISKLSNDALREKTQEFRKKILAEVEEEEKQIAELQYRIDNEYEMDISEKGEIYKKLDDLNKQAYKKTQQLLDEILPEVFAVVKDTARRFTENEEIVVTASEMDKNLATVKDFVRIDGDKAIYQNSWVAGGNTVKWDMIHYDVQLIGGAVLHQGKIAEMATGEGKTLVATLPVFLNALPGKGVHIVTVNDYLAKRDSEWMGVLYQFHGLTVDCIDKHQPHSSDRINAYLADITFGTNNEFGFDYLRDNMSRSKNELVQRPHNYVIVDEVDSVLIDDARTPLIISGPTPKGDKQEFDQLKPFVQKLVNEQKRLVTQQLAQARQLFESDAPDSEKEAGKLILRCHRGLPKTKALIKFLSEPGVKTLLLKTENFYMQEQMKHMHVIDDELFFVIEERNNSIDLTEKGIDLLTKDTGDPTFFILPDIGSEIVEIERTASSEMEIKERRNNLMRDFAVKSERVHSMNQLLKAYALFEIDVEYVVMDNKIKIVDEQTGRILEGRRYSDGLHQAIEAKENVKIEAATQTYATITLQNYFRMYGKLAGMTGTAETEAGELWDIYKLDVVVIPTNRPVIRKDQEDMVFKTKREKYNAVIDEIVNLVDKKRPVLVGTTSVEISELLSRMLTLKKIKHNVLNAKLHQKEADVVLQAGFAGAVTIATNMAGRGTDIKLGPGVKDAGGLAIIGTERHESRRVDRQLRGRSGRQGDPGSSQFFVSLEDDLMRIFGSERIAKIMDRLGLKEGEVIQHSMITKSIERAQKKVEENNFGIRKRLLEYDDVMNVQREAIYSKRRNALFGDKLAIDINNMFVDVVYGVVEENQESRDYENFRANMIRMFGLDSKIEENDFFSENAERIADDLYEQAYLNYRQNNEILAQKVYPIIKDVFENSGRKYDNIAIPFSDGKKTMNIVVPLKKAYESQGKEVSVSIEKSIVLAIIDDSWKEHLREMDELKQSVQHATYEQKDPLLIYKLESFNLFKGLTERINKEIVTFLNQGRIPVGEEKNVKEAEQQQKTNLSNLKTGRDTNIPGQQQQAYHDPSAGKPVQTQVRVEKKVGRNESCPCGSGKKYKNCHGA